MLAEMLLPVALMGAMWEAYRIWQVKPMNVFWRCLLFTAFLLIWLLPLFLKMRGVFSGWSGMALYHTLYFVFILNFVYFSLIAMRDLIWISVNLYQKKKGIATEKYDWRNVKNVRLSGYMALGVALLMSVTALYNGMKTPDVRVVEVETDKVESELRIAVLTDMHLRGTLAVSNTADIVRRVNEAKADVIVLVGDIIDDDVRLIQPHIETLKLLQAPKGKYAVAGNHEFYVGHTKSKKALQDAGFTYLFNEGVQLTPTVYLAGIPDSGLVYTMSDTTDVVRALSSAQEKDYKILLSHRPTFIDTLTPDMIDLQISGHTHGGQFFPGHLLAWMQNSYVSGMHETKNGKLYVSRGAGEWGPEMRLLAPAEITIVRLLPKGRDVQNGQTKKVTVKAITESGAESETLKEGTVAEKESLTETAPVALPDAVIMNNYTNQNISAQNDTAMKEQTSADMANDEILLPKEDNLSASATQNSEEEIQVSEEDTVSGREKLLPFVNVNDIQKQMHSETEDLQKMAKVLSADENMLIHQTDAQNETMQNADAQSVPMKHKAMQHEVAQDTQAQNAMAQDMSAKRQQAEAMSEEKQQAEAKAFEEAKNAVDDLFANVMQQRNADSSDNGLADTSGSAHMQESQEVLQTSRGTQASEAHKTVSVSKTANGADETPEVSDKDGVAGKTAISPKIINSSETATVVQANREELAVVPRGRLIPIRGVSAQPTVISYTSDNPYASYPTYEVIGSLNHIPTALIEELNRPVMIISAPVQ